MAPAAVPDTLPCESGAVFAREVKEAKDILSLEETEESWEKIRRSICRLHALYKGGGWQFEQDVVPELKTVLRPIINAMNSDRSKLSFEAIDLVSSLASLGRAFEPLLNLLFDALLKLCLKTSRILVARVQTAISRVVEETTLPGILTHLREAVKDKNQNLRTVASDAVLLAMNTFAPRDLAARVNDIEEIIRSTGRDANPGVRQVSRKIFEAYQILFPDRVDSFTAPLTPIMKKYLNVKARPVALNKSTKAVPFLPPHELAPASAPSRVTEFPPAHGHARSASASESLHARREPAPAAPAPQLRTQRSRPAMRAEMPPPSAPAPASEYAAHSFQPTRSAPAPAQRQRTQSTLSAKAAQSALAVDSARRGPQRVLAEPQWAPSVPGPEHPRIVSGPARVQRPATALGTVSSASTMGPPVTVTTHRAQRVLVPQPPPPPPEKPAPVERAPSRQDKERERPTHSRTGSGSNSNTRSNPPTRPGSAASMASRTKAAPTSKPTAAPSRPPLSKSAASTSRPPLSKSASTSRPPLSSSHSAAGIPQAPKPTPPVNCTMPLLRTIPSSSSTSSNPTSSERTGFVPKRNHATGGGATQMTASALARAKELREARERAAAAKLKVAKKPAAAAPKKAAAPAKPVEVPLPPSPGCPPREVPLPSSRSPSPTPSPLDQEPALSVAVEVDVEVQSTRDEVIAPLVLAESTIDKENVPLKTDADAKPETKTDALEIAALVAKLAPIALEEQAAADSFGPLDADEEELAGVEFATGHAFDAQGEVVRAVPRERMVLGAMNAQ